MANIIPAFLLAYSDSDFTNPHQVVLPDEPKDCRGNFTHMGAQFWGFETRRHKATQVLPGKMALRYDHNAHNWLQIGLKKRATISKITISTRWFTGNQVRAVSVLLRDELSGKEKQVLSRVPLQPDADQSFDITPAPATECMVQCYYEGGISRINFFGDVSAEQLPGRANLLERAKISHVSNEHFGKPDWAVRGNRVETHMIGWESARTGFGERALFALPKAFVIDEIVIDTYLHRLNPPLTAHVFGVNAGGRSADALMAKIPRWKIVFSNGRTVSPDNFQEYMLNQQYAREKGIKKSDVFTISLALPKGSPWKAILPFAPLSADTYHRFAKLKKAGAVTHLLYMHYPNGGIHGLKVFGS